MGSTPTVGAPHIAVREITPADGEFLVDMVLEAVNWEREHHTRRGVLGNARLSRYAVGWGRQGDLGLVAVDLDGPRGLHVPIGAAWLRYFASSEPGYGFYEPGVPELTLAIVPGRRRLGIGHALLAALIARARESGVRRISLSVARDNEAAVRLYTQAGFVSVGEGKGPGGTWTMLLEMSDGEGAPQPVGSPPSASAREGASDASASASSAPPSTSS
ncbi:MAG TPA: GNAT family N-acetyltransferase [Micrococcales bacterium]|uniref:GNAT family N-acetyltransferase n=1 Tax=Miniimonas TaxID=947525 RepID=UPI000D5269E8|nr:MULTISPECIES: GNAT family N-acetyltransferase [Miniimonas]HCX84400.1 GNAT family N-acetyltransferase [Micrococcales bacterium]